MERMRCPALGVDVTLFYLSIKEEVRRILG